MSVRLWRRPYVLRVHAPQTIVDGHASSKYKDKIVKLSIQPLGTNDLKALPEGERTIKRFQAWSDIALISADEMTGERGDRLFYEGEWYECKSCVRWPHTILKHWHSQFVLLPQNEQMEPPTLLNEQEVNED